jgi:hypothetical protein
MTDLNSATPAVPFGNDPAKIDRPLVTQHGQHRPDRLPGWSVPYK